MLVCVKPSHKLFGCDQPRAARMEQSVLLLSHFQLVPTNSTPLFSELSREVSQSETLFLDTPLHPSRTLSQFPPLSNSSISVLVLVYSERGWVVLLFCCDSVHRAPAIRRVSITSSDGHTIWPCPADPREHCYETCGNSLRGTRAWVTLCGERPQCERGQAVWRVVKDARDVWSDVREARMWGDVREAKK